MKAEKESWAGTIFGTILFPCLYVHATTNALYEARFPGIYNFKQPFYSLGTVCIMVLVGSVTWSSFSRYKGNGFVLGQKLATATMKIVLVVSVLGFMPCFYGHKDPHTLTNVLGHALLCPNYSIRSYAVLFLFLGLGVLLHKLSHAKDHESEMLQGS